MSYLWRRALRAVLVVYVAFLVQTTILPHLTILGMRPDLMAVAVILICLDGDIYIGFCSGAWAGLLLDAVVRSVAIIDLLFYPLTGVAAAAIAGALWGRFGRDAKFAFLVAPVVTLLTIALKESVLLGYIYLSGIDLHLNHWFRAGVVVLYSTVIAFPLQWPIRRIMYVRPKRTRAK